MSQNDQPVNTYGRGTKAVFAFMAFLMSVGFLVLILQSVPGFREAFGGPKTGQSATKQLVDDAQKKIEQHHCKVGMKDKADIKACKTALEDLAAGYRTLASPDSSDPKATAPKDAQHNYDKMLEAYRLRAQIDPTSLSAQADYAGALNALGKAQDAYDIFVMLTTKKPTDPNYAVGLAEAAQGAGKNAEAKAAWKSYIKRFPDDASIEIAKEQLKAITDQEKSQAQGGSPTAG